MDANSKAYILKFTQNTKRQKQNLIKHFFINELSQSKP